MTDLDARKLLGFRLATLASGGKPVEQKPGEKLVSIGLKSGEKGGSPVLGIKVGGKVGTKG